MMWRSSLNHHLRYTSFISDGDSNADNAVRNMNDGRGPYGEEHPVLREECVNHAAKRLGTSLRKLKQVSTELTVEDKKRKRSLGVKK